MEKLLIFGRGKYCDIKFNSIKTRYEIIGFIDNAVENEEFDDKFGYKVFNPCGLKNYSNCKIMCMSSFYIEMWKQLIDLGIKPERILFGINIPPFCSLQDKELFEDGQQLIAKQDCIIYRNDMFGEVIFTNSNEFKNGLREIYSKKNKEIEYIGKLGVKPISRSYGTERGTAVDRFYIEQFLKKNENEIKGTVMEIADSKYTRQFGGDKVEKELILHVEGWGKNAFKGNFETGEGIVENMADCLICTQTLQYIFNLNAAIKNIYKLLKPNGTALISVPGIKSLCLPDEENWGERWSFTKESMKQLCLQVCDEKDFDIESHGNVKIATAYLYGICKEELNEEDFTYDDSQFPFLITVKIKK